MPLPEDFRKVAPATQRNRQPILGVLRNGLNQKGNILEIASGTGEHAVFFAPHFPNSLWFPSDKDETLLRSIRAWQCFQPKENLQSPRQINVADEQWWRDLADLNITSIININMIHISPWSACLGLIKGAGELLPKQGVLYLYGAYKEKGKVMALSNQSFDQSLRLQNSEWGIRSLEDVTNIAQENRLERQAIVEMPANNLSVIFQKIG